MKKILSAIASVALIATCSVCAFAAGDSDVGESTTVGVGSGSGTNVPTGVVLTVVPVALAAGALTVSGIVLKKKNK